MSSMLLLLALLATASAAMLREQSTMTGDLFVFAYSWSPEFCATNAAYTGCKTPKDFWGKYFTIHGLWPQYSKGGYPHDCTKEAFNTSVPQAVGWDTMTTYWPNVQVAETDPTYDSFWTHEWTKHGTCTGLSQYDYFTNTINLSKKFGTPSMVTSNVGKDVSADDLRKALGGKTKVSLQCNGGNLLSGAYTCWSQTNGVPQAQVDCPSDVQGEDTCTKSSVTIKSF